MAMNRADYLKQGMEHYEKMKKVDGPLTLESLEYLGNSWQAKAFRDGFAYAILEESRQRCVKLPEFAVSYDPVLNLRTPLARQVCAARAKVLRKRGHVVWFSHRHPSTGKAVYAWNMHKTL